MAVALKAMSRARNTIILGLLLCVALFLQCTMAPGSDQELTKQLVRHSNEAYAFPQPPARTEPIGDPFEAKLRTAPVEFLRELLERYESTVRDYSCTFIKKERVNGRLRAEQEMACLFKEDPFSVHMNWVRPGDSLAKQAVYVHGKLKDAEGDELAYVRPVPPLDILAKRVTQEIHGKSAETASRRFIDQFGFANTLRMILKHCDLAARRGELDIRYVGEGQIDGRPTYEIHRRLPYTGEDGPYPERLLIVHIDKELLLPTGCFVYRDESRSDEALLGSYLWTNIKLNIQLSDADFTPEANNF